MRRWWRRFRDWLTRPQPARSAARARLDEHDAAEHAKPLGNVDRLTTSFQYADDEELSPPH